MHKDNIFLILNRIPPGVFCILRMFSFQVNCTIVLLQVYYKNINIWLIFIICRVNKVETVSLSA